MPSQETFASAKTGSELIQVIKTYDGAFAREAFDQMNEDALQFLSKSLGLEATCALEDSSMLDDADLLWEEMQEGAREDWNAFSYFIVAKTSENGGSRCLFVSADWPTAERFMEQELGSITP